MTVDERYPIGRYEQTEFVTQEQRVEWVQDIANVPDSIILAIAGLDETQLNTPYRDGGWTVAQVVHHLADAFLSHYSRFKWALTEENPTIKAFDEVAWAELPDAKTVSIASSLTMLGGVVDRFVTMMNTMGDPEWQKTFTHPTYGGMSLDQALGMYAWHGRHHIAQITSLRSRKGWT